MSAESLAESIARDLHAGQYDKDGAPYIEHVSRVSRGAVALVRHHAPSVDADVVAAIAWLHDVVEDTEADANDLRARGISDVVLSGVDALTKRAGEDYADAVRRAADHPVARWVKIADNLDNSDESRLAQLDEQTSARLRSKYRLARTILDWPDP